MAMDKADLLFLLDYSRWANQKLSETAALVSAAQFTAPIPATYGSLRGNRVNHTTQHRSESAEVLTQMGCSPGDLDLIWYLRRGA
jgi:uncharacterized damage-inducible protein DinB